MNNFLQKMSKTMTLYNSFVSRFQRARYIIKRSYSDKKYSDLKKMLEDKSRFERDLNTPEDILLYSYANKELKHTMIVVCGFTGMLMLLNSAHTVHISWNTVKRDNLSSQSWWTSFGSSPYTKYAIIIVMVIGGVGMAYLANYYVARVVKSITLLKGGQSINLETYRPFQRSNIRKVDVDNVTAVWQSQERSASEYLIKVRGDRVSYTMDMRYGKIIDEDTFYSTVGVKRSFR